MISKRNLVIEGLDDRLNKLNSMSGSGYVGKEELMGEAKKALKSVESKYQKDVESISLIIGTLLDWEEEGYPHNIDKFLKDLAKPYKGFEIDIDMSELHFNGDSFIVSMDTHCGEADFTILDMFEMDSESIKDYIESIKGFEKGFPSFKANFDVKVQKFTSSETFIPMEKKIKPKVKELMSLALKIEELKDKNDTMKRVYKEMLNIKAIGKGVYSFYLQFALEGGLVLKLRSMECGVSIICRSDNRGGVVISSDSDGGSNYWVHEFISACYHFEKVFDVFEKEFYKWFDKL